MAKKSILVNIVVFLAVIVLGIGVGFAVPMGKKLRTLPESESIVIMETTYKNGIPQDRALAYNFIESLYGPIDPNDEFFAGTEFKDLYLPNETVFLLASWKEVHTMPEYVFYNGMYNRWERMKKEFKKLKSYTYTLKEEKIFSYPGYTDLVYSGVATGIRHDGTEGTFEESGFVFAPTHLVIDKRG